MRILPECYACALRQALSAARLATEDEDFHHRCLLEAARILTTVDRRATPPEVGEKVYRMVRELSGVPDPFRDQKRRQNEAVMELLPWMRETVGNADDPLLMAVRLAIAGNSVDPGAQESFDLEKSVLEAVAGETGLSGYPLFAERLAGAGTVLVLADNCGEVVFDRVLIETMLESRDLSVWVAVRSAPVINDVTAVEAYEAGLCEVCSVIESGSEMPGTIPERCTPEFRRLFETSDVVISKGQGNWETLEECGREVFFMFQAKCSAVARINDCPPGRLLLLAGGIPHRC